MGGFWADIRKPKTFLIGVKLFLNDLNEKKVNHELFSPIRDSIGKNVVIDKTAKIENRCFIGAKCSYWS